MEDIPTSRDLPAMQLLERALQRFYRDPCHFDLLERITNRDRNKDTEVPSLRVIEWLVTNYARDKAVEYELSEETAPINLYTSYREHLDFYSKRMFDPFARRAKTTLSFGDRHIDTTPGQMNFFRWAISNGVVDYAIRHQDSIRKDLPKCKCRARDGPPDSGRPKKRCKSSDLAAIIKPRVKRFKKKIVVRFK